MFIYLDNAATTRVSDTALSAMLPYFQEQYGNPSSLYAFGQEAKEALERARETDTIRTNSRNMRSLESARITVEPQRFNSCRTDADRYSRCVRTSCAVLPVRRNAGTRRSLFALNTVRACASSNGLMVATSISTIGWVLAILRMDSI